MSKKKDPNIILRDKRLRDLVWQKKRSVKAASRFGCPFLDRMIDENYELIERMIKLEHFVWNVVVEEKKDEKTGEVYKEPTIGGSQPPRTRSTIRTAPSSSSNTSTWVHTRPRSSSAWSESTTSCQSRKRR